MCFSHPLKTHLSVVAIIVILVIVSFVLLYFFISVYLFIAPLFWGENNALPLECDLRPPILVNDQGQKVAA